MKKNLFLIPFCLLTVTACSQIASSTSSSNSSSSSSQNTSSNEIALPKSLEEIKANIEKTKFSSYSFADTENEEVKGTSTFKLNEIFVTGTKKSDNESTAYLIYKGYTNNKFYDIENNIVKKARIKNIVDTIDNYSAEITLENAQNEINSVTYNKDWFNNNLLSLFAENVETTFTSLLKENMYEITLNSYLGETKTAETLLRFDDNNNFISGKISTVNWGNDNFDTSKKEPIDKDQNPISSYTKSVEYVLSNSEDDTTKLDVDVSKYFVSSLDEYYVSSYDDAKSNDGKAIAGKYLKLDIRKFSPSTALNTSESDFKFVSSSNNDVIEVSENGYAKCLKEGTSTITIKDFANNITVTKDIKVETPALTSIWLTANNKNLTVGDKETIKIEALPLESTEELEVLSSANDILSVGTISTDRSNVEVTALKEGNAIVTVRSKKNVSVSKTIDFVVKAKEETVDTNWLIGSWNYKTSLFDTTFKFYDNGSGAVEQNVLEWDISQNTTFKWEYNGQLIFTDWGRDEYLTKPTSINIANDKSSISLEMKCDDGDGLVSVKMTLKKVNDTSWLIGTWNSDDDDFGTTVLVFKNDGTGTIKNGSDSARKIGWEYNGTTLSFPEDSWTPTTYWVSKVVSVSNEKIVINFEDDESWYNNITFFKA